MKNVGDFTHSQPTALALSGNWLNANATLTTTDNAAVFDNATYGVTYSGYWYPYYTHICDTYRRPVRLTMEEVERLRVAAKKDKALKATLEKFTQHIEVIVDFGKAA